MHTSNAKTFSRALGTIYNPNARIRDCSCEPMLTIVWHFQFSKIVHGLAHRIGLCYCLYSVYNCALLLFNLLLFGALAIPVQIFV